MARFQAVIAFLIVEVFSSSSAHVGDEAAHRAIVDLRRAQVELSARNTPIRLRSAS